MTDSLDPDEREIVRRIAYEDEVIPTDLRPETLFGKIATLRPRLRQVARDRGTTSYGEVTDGFTLVHRFRLGRILGIIGLLEDEHGRPLLPAVVKRKHEPRVGGKYFSLVEKTGQSVPATDAERHELWQSHLREVHDYWSQSDTASA